MRGRMMAARAGWATPPRALLARVRWLFLLASLFTGVALLPQLVLDATALPLRLLAVAAAATLCWRWVHVYRHGPGAPLWDPLEAALLFVIALAVGPMPALGPIYVSLYYRALYPSTPRTAARAFAYLAAFVGAVHLGSSPLSLASAEVIGQVFGFALSSVVMHVVAVALVTQERAVRREQALREAGALLMAATDRPGIYAAALAAYNALLADVPEALVTIAVHDGAALVSVASGGHHAAAVGDAPIALDAIPAPLYQDLVADRPVEVEGAEAAAVASVVGITVPVGDLSITPLLVQGQLMGTITLARATAFPRAVKAVLAVLGSQVLLALESMALTEDLLRRRGEQRFRALVQRASDLILVVDPTGVISYVSPSIVRVLGHAVEDVRGTNWLDLLHPDDAAHTRRIYAELAASPGASAPGEVRARHRDGSWRTLEVNRSNLLDEPGVEGIVVNARDITERRAFEEQLRHQAFHDPLTGLPNRALFKERVGQALRRARRQGTSPAVLFLDLDNFKTINDTLGHDAGDTVLTAVAARLRESLRADDTAARFGGDEFAILLEDATGYDDPAAVAERLIAAVRAPIAVAGREVTTNVSVGIAARPADATGATGAEGRDREGVDDLLRDADAAMYTAKAAGKGRHAAFDPAAHATLLARLELEADLRRALDRAEFTLHYQPIIDLETGALVGMEALVRWIHPERGLIPPDAFIPLAEETGLIVPLGRWVLRAACRQACEWRRRYPTEPPRRIAVNLSGLHLQHEGVVADVAAALEETGIDPACVTLEITESVMMRDTELTIARLGALKALGVSLAVDDFGTGYSSLSYLQQFPIDVLKIDRSFVSGSGQGVTNSALARAVVSLGGALGVPTVAEGVEEAGQAAQLRALGCEQGQGYYFSRPVAPEAMEGVLDKAGRGEQWYTPPAPDRPEAA